MWKYGEILKSCKRCLYSCKQNLPPIKKDKCIYNKLRSDK